MILRTANQVFSHLNIAPIYLMKGTHATPKRGGAPEHQGEQ